MCKLRLVLTGNRRGIDHRPVETVGGNGGVSAACAQETLVTPIRVRGSLVPHTVIQPAGTLLARIEGGLSFRIVGDVVLLRSVPFEQTQPRLLPVFAVLRGGMVDVPAEVPPFPEILVRIPLRAGPALDATGDNGAPLLRRVQRSGRTRLGLDRKIVDEQLAMFSGVDHLDLIRRVGFTLSCDARWDGERSVASGARLPKRNKGLRL